MRKKLSRFHEFRPKLQKFISAKNHKKGHSWKFIPAKIFIRGYLRKLVPAKNFDFSHKKKFWQKFVIIVSTAVVCKYNCLYRIIINSIGQIPCLWKFIITKNFVRGHSQKIIPKISQVLRLTEVSPAKVSLFKVWYFMFHVYFFVTSSILKSYFCLNLFTGYIFCFSLCPSISARK